MKDSMLSLPVNPPLQFGVPVSQICTDGNLHPGLRDLFLKAYLNIENERHEDDIPFDNHIQKILSVGTENQGFLEDRLFLKELLETGQYIISIQTPPGAPLWVIRHFLGRLPKPLLLEFDRNYVNTNRCTWTELSYDCRKAIKMFAANGQSLEKLNLKLTSTLVQLERGAYLILSALIGLIRNLAAGNAASLRLNKRIVFTLTCYYTHAITSRPFRPGFATQRDRRFYPLLLYLIYYWPDIRHYVEKLSNGSWFDQIIFEKPRLCDSLPIVKSIWKPTTPKSQSLRSDRITEPGTSRTIEETISDNFATGELIPLTYVCNNCNVLNKVEAKLIATSIMIPNEEKNCYSNKGFCGSSEKIEVLESVISNSELEVVTEEDSTVDEAHPILEAKTSSRSSGSEDGRVLRKHFFRLCTKLKIFTRKRFAQNGRCKSFSDEFMKYNQFKLKK